MHGTYLLRAWEDPNDEGEEQYSKPSDDLSELTDIAERLIKGPRFRCIWICRWNYQRQDYEDVIEEYP